MPTRHRNQAPFVPATLNTEVQEGALCPQNVAITHPSCLQHLTHVQVQEGAPCPQDTGMQHPLPAPLNTDLQEGAVQQRPLLDPGDAATVIKVLLGHGVAELVELGHVAFVDHAVAEHALHLMHPQPRNLCVEQNTKNGGVCSGIMFGLRIRVRWAGVAAVGAQERISEHGSKAHGSQTHTHCT